jgi:hypothetical protein
MMSTTEHRSGDGSGTASVATRLPGRIDSAETSFAPGNELAGALRRAGAAHGEHEKRTGQRDEDPPAWHAAYRVAQQAGTEQPT